jgi:hypothetical protein
VATEDIFSAADRPTTGLQSSVETAPAFRAARGIATGLPMVIVFATFSVTFVVTVVTAAEFGARVNDVVEDCLPTGKAMVAAARGTLVGLLIFQTPCPY